MLDINEFNQRVGNIVPNWSSAKEPEQKSLHGDHCVLEPIDKAKHAQKLFSNLSLNDRGERWTYLSIGPFARYEDYSHWLETCNAEKNTQLYAILNKKGDVLGLSGYLRINPEHGAIEVGHVHFSPLLQKTTAATEAMYLMMKYAFDDLGYRRYEWKCNSLNEASKYAALRLGFVFEGIFRQCNVFKGRNRDTAWFSIIDGEWPSLKKRFIKWLDKDNFDDEGNQLRRLSDISR